MKTDYAGEYTVRKIVESFLFMRAVAPIDFIDEARIHADGLTAEEVDRAIEAD